MSELNLRGLETLIRVFTWMIYIGVVVMVIGVIVGLLLGGAAEAVLIGASVGAGGLCTFAGVRGRKRGRESLGRLHGAR